MACLMQFHKHFLHVPLLLYLVFYLHLYLLQLFAFWGVLDPDYCVQKASWSEKCQSLAVPAIVRLFLIDSHEQWGCIAGPPYIHAIIGLSLCIYVTGPGLWYLASPVCLSWLAACSMPFAYVESELLESAMFSFYVTLKKVEIFILKWTLYPPLSIWDTPQIWRDF